MPDAATATEPVAHDKYERLIKAAQSETDDQGGRRASLRRCLAARARSRRRGCG